MPISAKVNAEFLIDSKTYTASLNIPSSAPTGASPFIFSVISLAKTPQDGQSVPAPQILLQVAVGGDSEVYVAVAPPMDLISGAVGSEIVKDLNLVVSEGNFTPGSVPGTGTFGPAPAPAPAPTPT